MDSSIHVIEFVMKSSAICRLRNCLETEAPHYHCINSLADAVKMVLVAVGVWAGNAALMGRAAGIVDDDAYPPAR
jgi:hypothetical protein